MTCQRLPVLVFIALLGVALPSAGVGQAVTVESAIPGCEFLAEIKEAKEVADIHRLSYCAGMIDTAVAATQSACLDLVLNAPCSASEAISRRSVAAELPPSRRAGAQAFSTWARANPGRWASPAGTGAIEALATAFPCRN